jgi:hypothetical protein
MNDILIYDFDCNNRSPQRYKSVHLGECISFFYGVSGDDVKLSIRNFERFVDLHLITKREKCELFNKFLLLNPTLILKSACAWFLKIEEKKS